MKRLFAFVILVSALRAATSVTQYGITWTFNTDYTTGQYANGDYYVVAPSGVTITGITPASTYTVKTSATVTFSYEAGSGTAAIVNWAAHGLKVGAPIKFSVSGGSLPTGLTAGRTYYITYPTNYAAGTFSVSTSPHSFTGDPLTGGTAVYGTNVTISSLGSGTITAEWGRTIHGTEVNPVSYSNFRPQGFDSALGNSSGSLDAAWDVTLNRARPMVSNVDTALSAGNPLVVAAGNSIVSTISCTDTSVSLAAADGSGARPQSTDAAILTVVASAPASGAFRPSPYGTAYSHTNGWNKSQLDYSILKSHPRASFVATIPVLATVEGSTGFSARPKLEWGPHAFFQYCAAYNNGPNYGRDIAYMVGDALFCLNMDYSNAQKENLYVRLVQYGIDLYGAAAYSNGIWRDNGGNLNGRKGPLVMAGLALADASILAYADGAQHFITAEDRQAFVVSNVDVSTVTFAVGSPGVVTWTAHGKAVSDAVAFTSTTSLPAELTIDTVYYVKTVLSADTFTVTAAPGSTVIAFSTAGTGTKLGRRGIVRQDWDRPAVYYTLADWGRGEEGNQHTVFPGYDGRNWTDMPYRDIISLSNAAQTIFIDDVTGGRAAWNWAPAFALMDYYVPNQITHGGATMPDYWVEYYTKYHTKIHPNIRSTKTLLK